MGFMGATHLRAFQQIAGAQVAAICSTDERVLSGDLTHVGGNLGQVGAKYDFSSMRKWKQWQDLAADPELDAIDICLPTDLHEVVAEAAMGAGKHVYCEKPMALSVAGCQRMIEQARRNRRILMIGQVLRFWPEYLALKQFVKEAPHGQLHHARFVRSCGLPDWSKWLPVEERSGGAVMDLLIHDIDQALMLFGMPGRVEARSLDGGDNISATLSYGQGLHVQIEGGWFAPGTPFSMNFQASTERASLELTPDGLFLNEGRGRLEITVPKNDAYHEEAAYFVKCCETGLEPELCLPQHSAKAVELAVLLKESRARGEAIEC